MFRRCSIDTPVEQHLFAIDKGDFRFAGCGGGKTGVVGEVTVGGQFADIDNIGPKVPEHAQINGLLSSVLASEV